MNHGAGARQAIENTRQMAEAWVEKYAHERGLTEYRRGLGQAVEHLDLFSGEERQMSPSRGSRSWSLTEMIDRLEHRQYLIIRSFTADERSLARAVAEAFYFTYYLTELPDRAPIGTARSSLPCGGAFTRSWSHGGTSPPTTCMLTSPKSPDAL
jgi:hypothetical protein